MYSSIDFEPKKTDLVILGQKDSPAYYMSKYGIKLMKSGMRKLYLEKDGIIYKHPKRSDLFEICKRVFGIEINELK